MRIYLWALIWMQSRFNVYAHHIRSYGGRSLMEWTFGCHYHQISWTTSFKKCPKKATTTTLKMTISILLTQFSQINWNEWKVWIRKNDEKSIYVWQIATTTKIHRSMGSRCVIENPLRTRRKHVQLSNRHIPNLGKRHTIAFCWFVRFGAFSAASIFHEAMQGYLIYVLPERVLTILQLIGCFFLHSIITTTTK